MSVLSCYNNPFKWSLVFFKMDEAEISKYNDKVVYFIYDNRSDQTVGIVRDSVVYEIRIFDPRARDKIVLVDLDRHRIQQIGAIDKPSDLEQGVLEAFLKEQGSVTLSFPIVAQKRSGFWATS